MIKTIAQAISQFPKPEKRSKLEVGPVSTWVLTERFNSLATGSWVMYVSMASSRVRIIDHSCSAVYNIGFAHRIRSPRISIHCQ